MSKHEIDTYTLKECNQKLLDFREKGIRSSEIITLLSRRILKLDPEFNSINDKHAALEQACMACIDYNDLGTAKKLFLLVDQDFPKDKSNRCYKLQLMQHENNQPDIVKEERDAMLAKFDTDQSLLKREIALEIQENNIEKAIELLIKHLDTFQIDLDAWLCLADLYIELGQYNRAAFCLEEIVINRPHTAHYHIRLAEIYYTWAALDHNVATKDQITENFKTSKFHYAHAIRLSLKDEIPNLRAIFGWMQATRAVNDLVGVPTSKGGEINAKAVEKERNNMNFMTNSLLKYKSLNLNITINCYFILCGKLNLAP